MLLFVVVSSEQVLSWMCVKISVHVKGKLTARAWVALEHGHGWHLIMGKGGIIMVTDI